MPLQRRPHFPLSRLDALTKSFSGTLAGWGHTVLKPLAISPRQRLDDALRVVDAMPFGATDCALPM
ncbi:MAG TPA: hypothetical protein PK648_18365, partial [Verrucomicrobiales bacterium]|nr:hypothetical protein [Verrucomicrobiales bacterium]